MLKPSKSSGYFTGENLAKSRNSKTFCCFKLQGLPIAEVALFTFGQDFLLLATEAEVELGQRSLTGWLAPPVTAGEIRLLLRLKMVVTVSNSVIRTEREGKPIRIYG